jgi:hypothetical protein
MTAQTTITRGTGRTGQVKRDRQNRTSIRGRSEQVEQFRQNRYNRTGRTGQAVQYRQKSTRRRRLPEPDRQNKTILYK